MALTQFGKKFFQKRWSTLTLPRRHGYIVLVPEIGEDLPEKNPLFQQNGLPEFNALTIENCMAAIGKQTLDFEIGVQNIEESIQKNLIKDVFTNVLDPIENIGAPLDTTWGLSKTLYLGNSTLMPTKSYLAIHDRARKSRATKFNSPYIFKAVNEADTSKRSEEQLRVLRKYQLEGKLNGLNMKDRDKSKLKECLNKLTAEKNKFKAKTEASTKSFSHQLKDPHIVKDFPVDLLSAMSSDPGRGPWVATLQPNVYMPFMENCAVRDLRWNIWLAMVGRGSSFGHENYSTSTTLEEIRFLRREQANILGYKSFAEMSMETKMAGSVENIKSIIDLLMDHARPAQERELTCLYEFAIQRDFKDSKIELWDVPYWRNLQQLNLYRYKDLDYLPYFPLSKVIDGLFSLCKRLFNIDIVQRTDVSTWAKDVKYFDVLDNSDTPLSGFYLDPYARTSQKLHIPYHNGWMVGIQNRSKIADMKPLAALVFNFMPPRGDKPCLLTFKDVKLLFHKFGQALQHLLTQTSYSDVSGLSNVEWDVVEVCGHALSHWLYNKSVIDSISSHCDTGDKLPAEMFDALINVRKHMAGLDLCRELYLSALDLELHSSKDFWLDIVRNLWPHYRCFPLHKYDAHPCSFTQIFVEEWAAAYYSNVWSQIIAADIYSAFHEVQNNEEQICEVGKRFKNTYLALGGSCNPCETFRKFRGRDPSPKALLTILGLKKVKSVDPK
ncbi:hypothetical protein RN001_009130 [Aquatica leii]|uniref:Peptidase M3A/M3B catalytic domain-containing protein n=1 Tax=Aquatica leii TaxID=1421715 RepID=A0AAN7P451_9COLE|nr:hypothetical protein RN001_009130 [Aquatica leii]